MQHTNPDLVCLSHLRWDFVFQRPQHLMSRFARQRRAFFIEEPVYEDFAGPELRHRVCPATGVHVVTVHLPQALRNSSNPIIAGLLADFARAQEIKRPIAWFYTPMALDYFPSQLEPCSIIYDCMDELTGFRGAPPGLKENEERLLKMADAIFTGGWSLFEAKRVHSERVQAFPSGVDIRHFAQARNKAGEPADQAGLARPRLGYAGVIDERMDLDLIASIARSKPAWQVVMIGPVVKIEPSSLPQYPNLHWLGMKPYADLPRYFSGWDVALLPFALNDATRFISPTKTPEYLSAGLPVVSTPIRDVVRPYGELGLARIASNADEFLAACEQAIAFGMSLKWRERADEYLQTLSWDSIWKEMNRIVVSTVRGADAAIPKPELTTGVQGALRV